MHAGEPNSIVELRALEANCAAAYFRSWQGMPTKWRGTSRRPIPDNWTSIEQRSSPFHLAGNRNAAHPVNAILSYAYAALESEIRIKPSRSGQRMDQTAAFGRLIYLPCPNVHHIGSSDGCVEANRSQSHSGRATPAIRLAASRWTRW